MPVINRVAEFQREIAGWRQDFHRHPELQYDVHRTAARVAELLGSFGVDEVVTGIGRTGVVAVIRGKNGGAGRVIGLRADMDALPITERTGAPYASATPGKMHACGHDGHTAMLLGAAKYLAETRNFDGTAILIFQPAEEGGGGGRAMLEDGLVERFGIEEFYGLHNMPGLPAGHFGIREGGIMAATDEFQITIEGAGGHAARPHNTVDPVLVAAQLMLALQTDRVAQCRSAARGGAVGDDARGGHRLQRHPAHRQAYRHGAHARSGRAQIRRGAAARGGRRHRRDFRRQRRDPLPQRLPGHRQRRRPHRLCRRGRPHASPAPTASTTAPTA